MNEKLTFDEIKEIIDLVRKTENVSAFTLKCGDVEISLYRGDAPKPSSETQRGAPAPAMQSAPVPSAAPQPVPSSTGPQISAEIEPRAGEIVIKSPMVGTFYRCPKPGDPPFVEVGQAVQEDTVLCIIEVMKLMNSLEAKVKGTVTSILVEDGQPVQHGQSLMIIATEAA